MRTINARKNIPVPLGFQGENEAVTVRFNVKGWEEAYGSGTFSLVNQRPTEPAGYECDAITVEDGILSWVVSDLDVSIAGDGHVQISYQVGDVIAKSEQYFTIVFKSINSEYIPAPTPTYDIATNAEIQEALYN